MPANPLVTLDRVSPFLRRRRLDEGVVARPPHAGLLRRERRALLNAREDLLRNLGGLLVEMYRRGGFRDDLLAERSAEVIGVDSRIAEIDALLHRRSPTVRCTCGAPLLRGSHFCPNCGRAVGEELPGSAGDETIIEPAPEP